MHFLLTKSYNSCARYSTHNQCLLGEIPQNTEFPPPTKSQNWHIFAMNWWLFPSKKEGTALGETRRFRNKIEVLKSLKNGFVRFPIWQVSIHKHFSMFLPHRIVCIAVVCRKQTIYSSIETKILLKLFLAFLLENYKPKPWLLRILLGVVQPKKAQVSNPHSPPGPRRTQFGKTFIQRRFQNECNNPGQKFVEIICHCFSSALLLKRFAKYVFRRLHTRTHTHTGLGNSLGIGQYIRLSSNPPILLPQ